MPTTYNQNAPSKHRADVTGKLPHADIFTKHGKDIVTMDTKPFGGAVATASAPVTANPPPVPMPSHPNASPPTDQINRAPAPAAPAAPAPAASAPAPAPAQAPPAPAQATPATPHMPAVGNVTKDNPKGEPGIGDNSAALDERRVAFEKQIAGLGQLAGQGANSRVELAVLMCQAASDGIIADDKGDVEKVYLLYRESLDKSRMDDRTVDKDIAAKDPQKLKSQVSKLRAFVKLGKTYTKGASVLSIARTVLPTLGTGSKFKSAYDALREVCAVQMKRHKADPKAKLLTKKEIAELLRADEAEEVEETPDAYELRKLESVLKVLKSIEKGAESADNFRAGRPSPQLTDAIEAIDERIDVLKPIIKQQFEEAQANDE